MKALFLLLTLIFAPYARDGVSLNGEWSAIVDQSALMGQRACQLLLRHISGDQRVYSEIVPQQLVIRQTSAKNTRKR